MSLLVWPFLRALVSLWRSWFRLVRVRGILHTKDECLPVAAFHEPSLSGVACPVPRIHPRNGVRHQYLTVSGFVWVSEEPA